jgi:hypothetical protein
MDDHGVNHLPNSVTEIKPVNCPSPKTILFKNCTLWSHWCEAMVDHLKRRGVYNYYVHREEDENGLWYCCICKTDP